jgi:hypothetical protein
MWLYNYLATVWLFLGQTLMQPVTA